MTFATEGRVVIDTGIFRVIDLVWHSILRYRSNCSCGPERPLAREPTS